MEWKKFEATTQHTEQSNDRKLGKYGIVTEMIGERFLMINNEWPESHWRVTVAIPTQSVFTLFQWILLLFFCFYFQQMIYKKYPFR